MPSGRLCLGSLRNRHEMYAGFSESTAVKGKGGQSRSRWETLGAQRRRATWDTGQDRGGGGGRSLSLQGRLAGRVLEESCSGQKRPRSGLLLAPTHLWRESREGGASLHTLRHSGWRLSAPRVPAGGLLGPVHLHERQRRSQCCGPRNIRLTGHKATGKHASFFFSS